MSQGERPPATVVCHVRAPLLLEPVDRQIETLQACESDGAIDDLLIRSWPKEVRRSTESPHQEVLETFDRVKRWADRRGVSVRPPFRERTSTSPVTGETKELLVTPLLCLEVYADDEFVGVFPHSEGEETYTTDEAIANVRTGGGLTPLGSPPPTRTESVDDACPDCGGELTDGQGLFACSDCDWVGTSTSSGEYVRSEPSGKGSGDGALEEVGNAL
ncbi:HTH domain-containing protein [Natrarchaeobius chitinivorans]|uniref:HTH domain-containing protein n=1 Tax=Natrarchaeobius chitinivorans TaxID=1679083 RepID=UPI001FB48350|nr:HTH domain-containing protein [Natrarchaeobius chitinivorans]